jgi:hypothetical protein
MGAPDQVILSSHGCQRIAEQAGHDIVGDAPELVVEPIRAVADAVRGATGSLVCDESRSPRA